MMRSDSRLGTDLGPYRIERVLGRGGMGVVYLASDTGLDRKVALKLLTPDYADDEAFRARFLRESKLAASIDHPNIIPVYDAGEIEGTFYLAMRYVEGVDLQQRVREGPLEPRHAVAILTQVASALDAAHAAGLVHRDVKPANILIAGGQGANGVDHAYLTDFGLTKRRGSQTDQTHIGSFLGTLDYISPEQIEGRPVDGRADQYALAGVAVSALTGAPPFPRDTDVSVINAHLHEAPPSVSLRRSELPSSVDVVIARGMAKAPQQRYPTCGALVDELRVAVRVSDTQSRPSGSAREGQRRDRRIAPVVGTLLIVGLVAIGGFVVASGNAQSPNPSAVTSLAVGASSTYTGASPTKDVFPNNAEAALLHGLPSALAATCVRGSYSPVAGSGGLFGAPIGGYRTPVAALECRPSVATGANEVSILRFASTGLGAAGEFTVGGAISVLSDEHDVPAGDCKTTKRATGRFDLAGDDAGEIICYPDPSTGDAVLTWGYDDRWIVVKATNARGDAAAAYRFFTDVARFISP
jgi:serine/threonine protein kinase